MTYASLSYFIFLYFYRSGENALSFKKKTLPGGENDARFIQNPIC
jgi:hypothetical protein